MTCTWDNSNTWMVNTGRSIDAAKQNIGCERTFKRYIDNGQTGGPPDTAKIDGATRQGTDRWTS